MPPPAPPPVPALFAPRKVSKWGDPLKKTDASEEQVEDACSGWLTQATPAPDLFHLPFHTLDRLTTSDSGSEGVIFCRCRAGVFVIKGCGTVAQELYSAQLANVLGMLALLHVLLQPLYGCTPAPQAAVPGPITSVGVVCQACGRPAVGWFPGLGGSGRSCSIM